MGGGVPVIPISFQETLVSFSRSSSSSDWASLESTPLRWDMSVDEERGGREEAAAVFFFL